MSGVTSPPQAPKPQKSKKASSGPKTSLAARGGSLVTKVKTGVLPKVGSVAGSAKDSVKSAMPAKAAPRVRNVVNFIAGWAEIFRVRLMSTPITALGWGVVAIAVVAWLFGWWLGWLELSTISAIAILLLLVAIPFVVGSTAVTAVLDLQSNRIVVGSPAGAKLLITNTGKRRALPFDVELPVDEAIARFPVPILAAGDVREELIVIPTEHRAVVPIGPARAVRNDPLGLMSRGAIAGETELLYIHPRTVNLDGLREGLLRDLEGGESKVISNSDLAFHTLREYVPGDDRRHIHWRSSAKAGQLMVRQFVETRRSQLTIVLSGDFGDYASDDEYETAVSVVASLGIQAIRERQELDVITTGQHIPTMTGQRFLDAMSGVNMLAQGGDMATDIRIVETDRASVSVVLLVTGSVVSAGTTRRLASNLSNEASVLIIRASDGAPSGVMSVGGVPTATVGTIDDLRRTLLAAGA